MDRYHSDDTLAFELSNASSTWKRRDSSQSVRSTTSTLSEPEPLSARPWRTRLPDSQVLRWLFYTLPLAVSLALIVLLAAFSPRFSERLDANACLPSGEFVLPGTTSIWDWRNFFTITVGFKGPFPQNCGGSNSLSDVAVLTCVGYSFTQAKVIDVAWDVIVGRGGQFVLVAVCYRVFREVLRSLMEAGEVGYDMFSTVAFKTGDFGSIITMVSHAVGWTPIPRTRRAIVMYWMMLLATIYVVSVPTLLSAMTGYTSVYAPFLNYAAYVDANSSSSPGGLTDCQNTFQPVWGRMSPIAALGTMTYTNTKSLPIGYQREPGNWFAQESAWIEYYERYNGQIYSHCPADLDISHCHSADIPTALYTAFTDGWSWYSKNSTSPQSGGIKTIPAPAPGIIPYPQATADSPSIYSHWACAENVIAVKDMTGIPGAYGSKAAGLCRAGNGYAWGFSFLLTFVVCVLNFFFVLLMYGLWFGGRRHRAKQDGGSDGFKDAVTMVAAAQAQYGVDINHWNMASLNKGIVKGYWGMGKVEDGGSEKVKRRRKTHKVVGGVRVIRD